MGSLRRLNTCPLELQGYSELGQLMPENSMAGDRLARYLRRAAGRVATLGSACKPRDHGGKRRVDVSSGPEEPADMREQHGVILEFDQESLWDEERAENYHQA